MINEMTTLASIGEMPALPMGLRYPRGLFGKARRSKRLHFRKLSKLKETTMRYLVIPDFLNTIKEAVDPEERKLRLKKIIAASIRARHGAKMAHDVLRGLQDRGHEVSAARKAKNQLLDKSYRARLIMQKFTGKDYRINELTPTTKLGTGKDSFRNRARAHTILRFDRGMSGKGEGPFGKSIGDFRKAWIARMKAKKLSSK